MRPEAIEIDTILFIRLRIVLVVDGIGSNIINVYLTYTPRDEQLDFIRHEVTQPVVGENALKPAHKSFCLLCRASIKQEIDQVHYIHRPIQISH